MCRLKALLVAAVMHPCAKKESQVLSSCKSTGKGVDAAEREVVGIWMCEHGKIEK